MVLCEKELSNMESWEKFCCLEPSYRDPPPGDPPPYPGHLSTLYQPAFRQSYSGSEASTDMSVSSNENLSTSNRQDPQGEENSDASSSPGPHDVFEDSPFDFSKELNQQDSIMNDDSAMSDFASIHSNYLHKPHPSGVYLEWTSSYDEKNHPQLDKITSTNTHILNHVNDVISACRATPSSKSTQIDNKMYTDNDGKENISCSLNNNDSSKKRDHLLNERSQYMNSHSNCLQELAEKIRPLGLNSVLAKLNNLNAWPDLTHLPSKVTEKLLDNSVNSRKSHKFIHGDLSQSSSLIQQSDVNEAAISNKATHIVDKLKEENKALREELTSYIKKLSKLQKFEAEIQKVHDAYGNLVIHSQKREKLEKAMRHKLESEIKSLSETNKELKDEIDKLISNEKKAQNYKSPAQYFTRNDFKKDEAIARLISENEEAKSARDKLLSEVSCQKLQISNLDNALSKAHANIIHIEEQLSHYRIQAMKVRELEQAVSQLLQKSQQREIIEERLRSHLEERIQKLKIEKFNTQLFQDYLSDDVNKTECKSSPYIKGLLQQMQDKEEYILKLESEILRWEQRFLEESAYRQLTMDATSLPIEAHLAAIEKGSLETDKILAETGSERMNYLEEIYQANKKAADLETKNRILQAQIVEKDAMIDVIKKHGVFSRCASISSLYTSNNSPIMSSRSSFGSHTSSTPSPPPLIVSSAPSDFSNDNLKCNQFMERKYKVCASSQKKSSPHSSPNRAKGHQIFEYTPQDVSKFEGRKQIIKYLWQV